MKTTVKSFLVGFIGALSLLIAGGLGTGYAAVQGICSDCHTMHNSQGGSLMAQDETGTGTDTPYRNLTRSNCMGCHNGNLDATYPNVVMSYATEDANVAAGGSFATHSAPADDAKVHNVTDGSGNAFTGLTMTTDSDNGATVPGGLPAGMNLGTGTDLPANFTCAGTNGCHGDVNAVAKDTADDGIRGYHHESTAYRFLEIAGGGGAVSGKGSTDWEMGGASATNHNVYAAGNQGINGLCANCHQNFHNSGGINGQTGGGSEWIRHPTDNLLSDVASWDLSSIAADYDRTPFCFTDGSAGAGLDTATAYTAATVGAAVSCLSCHRAHGSPYDDLLRFAYSGMIAGGTTDTGCLNCHYKQR